MCEGGECGCGVGGATGHEQTADRGRPAGTNSQLIIVTANVQLEREMLSLRTVEDDCSLQVHNTHTHTLSQTHLIGEGCGVSSDSLTQESVGSVKGSLSRTSVDEPSPSSEVTEPPTPDTDVLLYMSLISSSLLSNLSRLQNVTRPSAVLLTRTWTSRLSVSLVNSSRLKVYTTKQETNRKC